MTHFELMEKSGQTNIFDFINSAPVSKCDFVKGDQVKIRFYVDEIEFIETCHPQLMEVGEIVGKHQDFYIIQIGEAKLHVEGDKLILI